MLLINSVKLRKNTVRLSRSQISQCFRVCLSNVDQAKGKRIKEMAEKFLVSKLFSSIIRYFISFFVGIRARPEIPLNLNYRSVSPTVRPPVLQLEPIEKIRR